MSNSYFQFKEFTIHQDRCAMKVCTDACLFGAWFAHKTFDPTARVLDIGSGTGLLMLMLAQKHPGEMQGIELNRDAFDQLKENIAQSQWNARLKTFLGDARQFVSPNKFDLIITNPPFFEHDLVAVSDAKNMAKHGTELSLTELMIVIDTNLGASGSFGILLPYSRTVYFKELAAGYGFYMQEKLIVRQTPGHEPFRSILHFSRRRQGREDHALTIRDLDGKYTEEFVKLMKDYYLYL